MGKMNVELCGITLDNPVIPASGTFGYGREFAESGYFAAISKQDFTDCVMENTEIGTWNG